jgi:hypothetical protein
MKAQHLGWLAHDDDNHVVVLYVGLDDSPRQQARELAKLIRRGLWVRRILDVEGAARSWGKKLSEAELYQIAAAPDYDPSDGSATFIAMTLTGAKAR